MAGSDGNLTKGLIRRFVLAGCAIFAGVPATGAAPDDATLVNSIGMRLVSISAGEFQMGSAGDDSSSNDDERPRHRVRITRAFRLGVYEVTQAEYQAVMGTNPCWFSAAGPGRETVDAQDTSRWPVDRASFNDAVEFCRELSQKAAEKAAGRVYRLPTEAEWEYACRAGTTTRFNLGDVLRPGEARAQLEGPPPAAKHLGHPLPVGSFRPNAFGLYDMHGNVWEWCSDEYAHDYYRHSPTDDPPGPAAGTGHVVRGGDWHFEASACRSANRDFTRATRRNLGTGFRVACDAPARSKRAD
ncbi:MAG TPA: formylglycine-generating enzyme family protein [Pirellulales bacterium]|nr:formylglycine-generating enzyme family protein [Pirellulales bacterium]